MLAKPLWSALDRAFAVSASGSSLRVELRAGLTTFLTMSYILFVNPDILSKVINAQSGVSDAFPKLLFVTAAAAAAGSLLMGLLARYPYAQAPGMGLNAYFAFTVVQAQGVPFRTALGLIFFAGLLFAALSVSGARRAIIDSLPASLKEATTAGIGLFLALIGLRAAGIVVASPATLVTLGDLRAPAVAIAACGLLVTAALLARRVSGAILYGIVAATLLAVLTSARVYVGADGQPAAFPGLHGSPVRLPIWPSGLAFTLDLRGALQPRYLGPLLTFLFVGLFDSAGTLIGLSSRAGFLDQRGELPRASRAFLSDALATSIGAVLGTSATTCYLESAAGIEEGGRTGLTAVAVAGLFLLALFLWPLCALVPGPATAPALIVVGAMMMSHAARVRWDSIAEALPAFLTITLMPLTFSIATGISLGIIAHVAIQLLSGQSQDRRVPLPLLILAALLLLRYLLLPGA